MGERRTSTDHRGDLEGLVVVGCSRRKKRTNGALPALELYEGWCVPALRERVAAHPALRQRVLVLSGRYGLVRADDTLAPYDERLTPQAAGELRGSCEGTLREHLAAYPAEEALLLLEPFYADVLEQIDDYLSVVYRFTDPVAGWDQVLRVLDAWGWR